MEAAEVIEYPEGYTVEIHYEDCPFNPRVDYDTSIAVLTQLSCRFMSPGAKQDQDKHIIEAWDRTFKWRSHSRRNWHVHSADLVERFARIYLHAVATDWRDDPHSESKVFGYITQEACDTVGAPDPAAALQGEIEEYDQYANGEVFGYIIKHPERPVPDDSCWGYYGETSWRLPDGYMRQEFEAVVNFEITAHHAKIQQLYRSLVNSR